MFLNLLAVAATALIVQTTPADTTSAGRKLVRLISAESAQLIVRDSITYRKVTGPAQFLHNDTYILCDSAIWNVEQNVVDAMGNVQVIQNETILYSDKINYLADSSLAKVRGNLVQLVDKDNNRLRTHFLDFHTKDSIAVFFQGGSMMNKDGGVIESLEGVYESKIKKFRFLKNVEMKSDSTLLKADSLAYFSELNKALFLSLTHVWQDTVYLRANGGWYERDTEKFLFSDNAYVLTKKQEIWADQIFYDKKTGKAELIKDIQIVDTSQKVIFFADKGNYVKEPLQATLYEKPSMAYFSAGEEQSDTLFLSADTLKYYTRALGDIDSAFVADAKERYKLSKKDPLQTLINNVKNEGEGEKGIKPPQLTSPPPGNTPDTISPVKDSLLILKDTISTSLPPQKDTTTIRFTLAYNNVKIFKGVMQAKSDSLTFNSIDSIARLYTKPVMWNEGSQFTADSIQFVLSGNKLSKAELMSNAYYISREDSLYYNQIKSTDMIGFFTENKLTRFDALGGASLIFFLAEDSVTTMMNEKECKFLSATIDSAKLSKVKYFDGIKSNIFPIVSIEKGKERLKGFTWRESEKPITRFDVCNRKIRPSEGEEALSVKKPLFPNTRRFFPKAKQAGKPDLSKNILSEEKKVLPDIQR
ncbi:MAG: OstA-like protein [Bacteroidales bacterium]